MVVDTCRKVGSLVQAKAFHVTSIPECRRLYGSNWNQKLLCGTVLSVRDKNEGNQSTGKRKNWLITAEYDLNGTKKVKELNVRSVYVYLYEPSLPAQENGSSHDSDNGNLVPESSNNTTTRAGKFLLGKIFDVDFIRITFY